MISSEAEVIHSPKDAYRAAHESAVIALHNERGVLQLTGGTRLDLINRMSTQAVTGLKSGEGAATVLTTEIGRIIDRPILYATSDSVYVLTGEGHADALARYLLRNIFFNDDVRLKNVSADTAICGVYGPVSYTHLDVYKRQAPRRAPQMTLIDDDTVDPMPVTNRSGPTGRTHPRPALPGHSQPTMPSPMAAKSQR